MSSRKQHCHMPDHKNETLGWAELRGGGLAVFAPAITLDDLFVMYADLVRRGFVPNTLRTARGEFPLDRVHPVFGAGKEDEEHTIKPPYPYVGYREHDY